ncbi:MAG: hypothetical protein P4L61_00255, partial [Candidatus Pacebacteria bacterium]|nr:hypothetical protein [Candidatus Paceibacterota bacterium]
FPAMGQKHATTRTPVAKLIVFDITGSGRTFPKNSAKRGLEDEEFHEDLEKMEAACGYDEYIAPILNA